MEDKEVHKISNLSDQIMNTFFQLDQATDTNDQMLTQKTDPFTKKRKCFEQWVDLQSVQINQPGKTSLTSNFCLSNTWNIYTWNSLSCIYDSVPHAPAWTLANVDILAIYPHRL